MMIAVDLQPISLVENQGFRNLMKEALPRYELPSRKYFTERVLNDMYEHAKRQVMDRVSSEEHLSFTTDLWTSE